MASVCGVRFGEEKNNIIGRHVVIHSRSAAPVWLWCEAEGISESL